MSNWQKGDLALCVAAGPVNLGRKGRASSRCELRKGAVYTVVWVGLDGRFQPHPCLGLEGVRSMAPKGGFAALRFRKVTPPKADEFDREVIDLMAGKKVEA